MLNFTSPINTRIAPSPTGNAHIGLVRTAYLNYLAARSTGGKFILRIDDTDSVRSNQIYTDDILNTLSWLGIDFDFTFNQSSRFDRYKSAAYDLVDKGRAIIKDGAVILQPNRKIDSWNDIVSGNMPIPDDKIDAINNLILLRSDGTPTYHFASVIDDIDHDINVIIRGTDHIDNTAKHVYIYDVFDAVLPTFAHVGLIFYIKKKISKRDGISNMQYYKDNGFLSDAILNAVLKMGWSHPDANIDKVLPLIDKAMAISIFKQGHLKSAPSSLDLDKLKWLDKKYKNKLKVNNLI